jgi:hypothetical protein
VKPHDDELFLNPFALLSESLLYGQFDLDFHLQILKLIFLALPTCSAPVILSSCRPPAGGSTNLSPGQRRRAGLN